MSMTKTANNNLLYNLLLAGGAAGAGLGLGISLMNHLRSLKKEQDMLNADSHDNNTMKVVLRSSEKPKKAQPASRQQMVASSSQEDHKKDANTGLAITLALLAGTGMYGGVQRAYQGTKRKDLQKRLERSQTAFIDLDLLSTDPEAFRRKIQERHALSLNQGEEDMKKESSDSRSLTAMELLGGLAGASPYLLALAGFLGVGHLLNKQFPAPKDPLRDQRKKIQVTRQQTPSYPDEAEDIKQASSRDISADLSEALFSSILDAGDITQDSQFFELAEAAAQGKTEQLKTAFREGGLTAMFEYATKVAGADRSKAKINSFAFKTAAVSWLVRDPLLSPVVRLVAASEYRNLSPTLDKVAQALPEGFKEVAIDLLADLALAHREEAYRSLGDSDNEQVKKACVYRTTAEALEYALKNDLFLS